MTETPVEKVNLLGLTLPKMEAFFISIGEKKFRGAQMVKWIHQQGIRDFEQMTNLSKALREKLKEIAEVRPPRVTFEVTRQTGRANGYLKLMAVQR